jgi:phosphoglycerate dehydrogenase-like enzyme
VLELVHPAAVAVAADTPSLEPVQSDDAGVAAVRVEAVDLALVAVDAECFGDRTAEEVLRAALDVARAVREAEHARFGGGHGLILVLVDGGW